MHDLPTLQTVRQTDRQTTSDSKTALCTVVRRAVKIKCANSAYSLQLLLLDSNETGVSWMSFGVISCLVHHRRQLQKRCMWQKVGSSEAWKPWSCKRWGGRSSLLYI